MGFASYDEDPVAKASDPSYETVDAAYDAVEDEYTEYGISIHPECDSNAMMFTDAELGALILVLALRRFTTPAMMSALVKLEAEDNRRFNERSNHS
jgi:hypothetical protein